MEPGVYAHTATENIKAKLKQQGYDPVLIREVPHATLDTHQHRQSHVIVIVRGQMQLTLEDSEYLMQPGDLVTIAPHVRHAAQFGAEGCDYLWAEY